MFNKQMPQIETYKHDTTMHGENELSLLVFNCEHLYNMRRRRNFFEYIAENFTYTDEQLKVLKQDLSDEE